MLDVLYRVPDIQKRYGCAESTARKYMRQMRHTEKPLTVTESAVRDWDESRMVPSQNELRGNRIPKKVASVHGGHIVPRIRT